MSDITRQAIEQLRQQLEAAQEEARNERTRAEAVEADLRDLRKALTIDHSQPSQFVAVVGACNYELEFTRLIRVVGPFPTRDAATAAGEIESQNHEPDEAADESSIEFDVVAWQGVREVANG